MNTTSLDIDDGTFQLLSQSPNQWKSVVSLYNEFTKDHPKVRTVDKKQFILTCELLHTRFKHVKKCYRNGMCHLAFITDDSFAPKEVINECAHHDTINDDAFKSMDKCEVIQYMLNNKEHCATMSMNEYFDGTDTVLHILFRNGKVDMINRMRQNYDVDFNVKNADGETLIDVINFDDSVNAPKLVRVYFEQQINKLRLEHANDLKDIRQVNTQLMEQNKRLSDENKQLKQYTNYSDWFKFLTLACLVLIITF